MAGNLHVSSEHLVEDKIQCAPLSSHLINNFNGAEISWPHHRSSELKNKVGEKDRISIIYSFSCAFFVSTLSSFTLWILCNFLTIFCVLGCERGKIPLRRLCVKRNYDWERSLCRLELHKYKSKRNKLKFGSSRQIATFMKYWKVIDCPRWIIAASAQLCSYHGVFFWFYFVFQLS